MPRSSAPPSARRIGWIALVAATTACDPAAPPPVDTCTPAGGACVPLGNLGMPSVDSPPDPACYDFGVWEYGQPYEYRGDAGECTDLWHSFTHRGYATPRLCCFPRDAGAE